MRYFGGVEDRQFGRLGCQCVTYALQGHNVVGTHVTVATPNGYLTDSTACKILYRLKFGKCIIVADGRLGEKPHIKAYSRIHAVNLAEVVM